MSVNGTPRKASNSRASNPFTAQPQSPPKDLDKTQEISYPATSSQLQSIYTLIGTINESIREIKQCLKENEEALQDLLQQVLGNQPGSQSSEEEPVTSEYDQEDSE